jgi:hypothetical protein
MLPDTGKYIHHLERLDLSREEKESVIRALWRILEGFVDRSFHQSTSEKSEKEASDHDSDGVKSLIQTNKNEIEVSDEE